MTTPQPLPEDETLYSLERARAVLFVLAGMALQWAALHSITFMGTIFYTSSLEAPLSLWTVNSVTTFSVFLLLFFMAGRIPSLLDNRLTIPAIAGCLVAGTALLVAGSFCFSSGALVLAGNALIALGTTPLIVVWGEAYKYLNPQNEQLLVTLGGIVLSVVIYLVEIHLPQPLAVAVFACLPLASVLCLTTARTAFRSLAQTWASTSHSGAHKSPALLYVCIAVFSIPYDYLRSSGDIQGVFGDVGLWSQILSVTIVIMVVAAIAEYAAERRGLLLVPSLVLLLLSAALVLSLVQGGGSTLLMSSLLYAGYYLFLAMVYSALGPIVATTSTNPTRLFSGAMIANVGGLLLGTLLGNLVDLLGEHNSTMVVLGITYAVFIVGLVVFNSHSYSVFRVNYYNENEYSFEYLVPLVPLGTQPTGNAPASPEAPAATPSERAQSMFDAIAAQCASLAREAGLSAREAEVLVELARGRTLASIAATFVVSENTIKAHTKAIYRKLEVHTREELLGRVEAFARDEG